MHKLSHLAGNEWAEHSFEPVFALEANRITGAVPAGSITVFENLVSGLTEPVILLYILHTPRGEGDAGRYQSPELTTAAFRAFLSKYRAFLTGDARFDIWAYSPHERATVVWDRHNQFFAYGPIQQYVSQLMALGFKEDTIPSLGPHQHHYRPELDPLAKALLDEFPWSYSPLRPEDEQ